MEEIHGPVVAGTFYPADAAVLRTEIRLLLDAAAPPLHGGRLAGLIVPHAGLIYSGPVAAAGYRLLRESGFGRVVAIGPSHFSWFDGIAALPASGWRTPLGVVSLEDPNLDGLVHHTAAPYAIEHSLEVQLPFLQETLPEAVVIPLLLSDVDPWAAALFLDRLLSQDDLLIVSSDLSHYHDRSEAARIDAATIDAITSLDTERVGPEAACGHVGIGAALALAEHRGWRVTLLDHATSADTAGGPGRVVGYGAFAITATDQPSSEDTRAGGRRSRR